MEGDSINNSIHFNHCLDHSGCRLEPTWKFIFHPIERDAMRDKSRSIDLFAFQRINNIYKVLARSITAAHKGSFPFVKFGMTECYVFFLKSHQYETSAMSHVLKCIIDRFLAPCGINDYSRHIVRCDVPKVFQCIWSRKQAVLSF